MDTGANPVDLATAGPYSPSGRRPGGKARAVATLVHVSRSATLRALVAALAALLVLPATALALPGAHVSATKLVRHVEYPETQHLRYEYGPIQILPGQNNIEFRINGNKPTVPGFITRFHPDLVYSGSRKVPRVDVIHLHHGVWINNGYPTFAAGEEKTTQQLPRGYGYHYSPSDSWIMNYMIHNLTPRPTQVSITYDLDFVPDGTASASKLIRAHPLWMDVAGLKAYPVFDALKGQGRRGKFTFPNQASASQQGDVGWARQYVARRDMTLLQTAGHLHPGGLYTDLKTTRGGRTKELFRSVAKYFEPAGAVSWDVSMTHTKPSWRVAVKAGDRLNISATYDTSRASWYESMGIMVMFYADGITPGAKDPFRRKIETRGLLTHGHLRENRNHGGKRSPSRPDARTLPDGVFSSNLEIRGFSWELGNLLLTGRRSRPPLVRAGQSITFTNLDATRSMGAQESAYHTITSCKAPCTGSTGIAYPLANGRAQFDSGELGFGPGGSTPAENTNTWQTPRNLTPGTYTYFCRIHPFMRGAFRVVPNRKKS
jgi:plastocyanin